MCWLLTCRFLVLPCRAHAFVEAEVAEAALVCLKAILLNRVLDGVPNFLELLQGLPDGRAVDRLGQLGGVVARQIDQLQLLGDLLVVLGDQQRVHAQLEELLLDDAAVHALAVLEEGRPARLVVHDRGDAPVQPAVEPVHNAHHAEPPREVLLQPQLARRRPHPAHVLQQQLVQQHAQGGLAPLLLLLGVGEELRVGAGLGLAPPRLGPCGGPAQGEKPL
mmetsp:Transcript_24381/g.40726  ORF Transcript_24381/g.40726 Transcript_24381/m.40726 type:complete len:220 (+) Transcript_24381:532-1191(+)